MPQKEITVKVLIYQCNPSNNEWLVCWFLSQLLFGFSEHFSGTFCHHSHWVEAFIRRQILFF